MQLLCSYHWPGNVRELDHTIERAVLMAQENIIQLRALGLQPRINGEVRLENMTLDEIECSVIRKTLKRFNGDISKTASALGLSRAALYRRIDKYQIQ